MKHESYEKALNCLVGEADETTALRFNSKATEFKKMLNERGLEYTIKNIDCMLELLLEDKGTREVYFEHRKIQFNIVKKMLDNTETGENPFLHYNNTTLPTWCRDVIEQILSFKPSMNIKLSSYIRCNLSHFIEQLLIYAPCNSLSGIPMLLLRNFLREHGNNSPHHLFWRYYALQQDKQYLFIEKLRGVSIIQKLLSPIDFIVDLMSFPKEYSVEEFYMASRNIIIDMQNDGYSKHTMPESQRAFNAFGLFLETNELWYSKELVHAWALEMNRIFKIRMRAQEDYLLLADSYMKGQKNIRRLKNHARGRQEFPEWSQELIQAYLAERIQDGFEESTLAMDRACLLRFMKSLDLLNITSFESVTPMIVKNFNLQDMNHKTPEAKNAYNTRIRGFLRYLERTEAITTPLANALPCSSAISIRPVQVLRAEEDVLLMNAMKTKEGGSRTFLRDVAIVKLERFLGLRVSDALSLKFHNIDIPHMEIHIVQKKTHKQLILHLPNTILNSIVRYIETERPKIESRYIFLTSRHPFKPLESASIPLLECLFGERVKRKNHILRKTLSTEMLCSGTTVSLISDTLGHSSNDSVAKYLDTNDKTMRLCCLSLKGIAYTGNLL